MDVIYHFLGVSHAKINVNYFDPGDCTDWNTNSSYSCRKWMVKEALSLLENQHGDKQKSACVSVAACAVSGKYEHGIASIFH